MIFTKKKYCKRCGKKNPADREVCRFCHEFISFVPKPPEPAERLYCPNCHAECTGAKVPFCSQCNISFSEFPPVNRIELKPSVADPTCVYCPCCGSRDDSATVFCRECGCDFRENSKVKYSPYSKAKRREADRHSSPAFCKRCGKKNADKKSGLCRSCAKSKKGFHIPKGF